MKKLLLITFSISLNFFSQSGSFSESLNFYGEKISTENILDYNSFIENSKVVSRSKIEGTILSSCPKKVVGCRLKLILTPFQVTFKDYGFFCAKTGLENKKTILEGYQKQDTISKNVKALC